MISIFANFMINNQTRLEHMKDSLNSFKNISDDWLINVRGKLRNEAVDFLKENLGDKLVLFELLAEDKWFQNSSSIVKRAKHDYVLWWVEDHINLAPENLYLEIVREMKEENADYLPYSWWLGGNSRLAFEVAELKRKRYADVLNLTKKIWRKQLRLGLEKFQTYQHCLITTMGIFKKSFLIKQMEKERHKWPRFITKYIFFVMIILDKLGLKFYHRPAFDFINRLCFGKLTKVPYGPFDFEKTPWRLDVLPLKIALPKQELFACIDDDASIEGYQLIKRGLYPRWVDLKKDVGEIINQAWGQEELLENNPDYMVKKYYLNGGGQLTRIYYAKENRMMILPRETIINLGDDLSVSTKGQEIILKAGESISIYPNLDHTIRALGSQGVFLTIIPTKINR